MGKISRTAAGGAASLTIVWQQFRFRLCSSTLLFSSSPASPAYVLMYAIKPSLSFSFKPFFFASQLSFLIFVLFFFRLLESLAPSYAVSHLSKPQRTLEAGLEPVCKGQV